MPPATASLPHLQGTREITRLLSIISRAFSASRRNSFFPVTSSIWFYIRLIDFDVNRAHEEIQ